MENLNDPLPLNITMKIPLILALLAGATYLYFQNSAAPTPAEVTAAARRSQTLAAPVVTIAAAPSSYERWKTGPNAQTDLKTGPNAQTEFQPFAPSEHATWNQTPGYTISGPQVSGRKVSRRMLR
jgi:curli biogenesis system outer membrane secretion channel CsgG